MITRLGAPYWRGFLLSLVAVGLPVRLLSASVPCDWYCNSTGSQEYYQLLDEIFPRVCKEAECLVLRYIRPHKPELEILITTTTAGNHAVEIFSLPEGSKTIGEQLVELKALYPHASTEELSKHIASVHQQISLDPGPLAQVLDSLKAVTIAAPVDRDLTMDAPIYDFWSVAPPACHFLHVRMTDVYSRETKKPSLIRWMNRVQMLVSTNSQAHGNLRPDSQMEGKPGDMSNEVGRFKSNSRRLRLDQ